MNMSDFFTACFGQEVKCFILKGISSGRILVFGLLGCFFLKYPEICRVIKFLRFTAVSSLHENRMRLCIGS